MNKDDELLFADEVTIESKQSREPWKVVIADDEEEVHAVTRMVLDNFTFEGRGLELLSALFRQRNQRIIATTSGYCCLTARCGDGRGYHRA